MAKGYQKYNYKMALCDQHHQNKKIPENLTHKYDDNREDVTVKQNVRCAKWLMIE